MTGRGIRDLGYAPGDLPTGKNNSILDVPGLHVGQVTVPTSSSLPKGCTATKGATVILPRPPKDFYKPCTAGSFTFNGNGELTGSRQVADWGFTNTPIVFTNSLSLGTVFDGAWDWILDQQDKLQWDGLTRSRTYGTPVCGETADWLINSDLRSNRLDKAHIAEAFANIKSAADGGVILEGQAGGGCGMTCHQFPGGTGTSSRVLKGADGKEYVVGVLCQTNYGGKMELSIGGVPVGKILLKESQDVASKVGTGRADDGSILVLIVTDAPLASHQLNRVARHATAGLAQVGTHGIGRTFSGDIFLALSTADRPSEQLSPDIKLGRVNPVETYSAGVVKNECIDPFFIACAEATEEAILNSIVGGHEGVVAMDGTRIQGLPLDRVRELLSQHLVVV